MDSLRFDALARFLSRAGSRRRVFGLLAAVPLLAIFDGEEGAARERRRRRKNRHKSRQDKASDQRERKRRKSRCRPKSRALVCADSCGPIKSRQTCGKTVDCGSCACDAPCGVCLTCQAGLNTAGQCVADPAQVGETCGAAGQRCQADGACACDAGSCANPTPICDGGSCRACSAEHPCPAGQCCQADGTCVADCPTCQTCEAGQCVADAALRHACVGPCASGEWCDAGACAPITDTVRLPDCGGWCGASAVVCGQTVTCPSCDLCSDQTGCSRNSVKNGPLGPGDYCSWSLSSLTCSTNADCVAYGPDEFGIARPWCINGSSGSPDHCAAICPF